MVRLTKNQKEILKAEAALLRKVTKNRNPKNNPYLGARANTIRGVIHLPNASNQRIRILNTKAYPNNPEKEERFIRVSNKK